MTPEGDHLKILKTLNAAVRRRCIAHFCIEKKIGPTTLYQAIDLKAGNPSLRTFVRIVNALGYDIAIRPKRGKNGPLPGYPKRKAEAPAAAAEVTP